MKMKTLFLLATVIVAYCLISTVLSHYEIKALEKEWQDKPPYVLVTNSVPK